MAILRSSFQFAGRSINYIADHSWSLADHSFKLLSWVFVLGITSALAEKSGSLTAVLVVRFFTFVWAVALYCVVFNGTVHLLDHLVGPPGGLPRRVRAVVMVLVILLAFAMINVVIPSLLDLFLSFIRLLQEQRNSCS